MNKFLIGSVLSMILSVSVHANAAAPISLTGTLQASKADQSNPTQFSFVYYGLELKTVSSQGETITYDLLPRGNACGRAIVMGQLLRAGVGSVVEMAGEVQDGSERADESGIHAELLVDSLPDGSSVHILKAAGQQE